MAKTIELNFIAKDNPTQLESTITLLEQQKLILSFFHKALDILSTDLNRHHKFRRITPTVKFIYQANSDTKINRRQRALATLDLCSKSLCVFALQPDQIRKLKDEPFDAIVHGLPEFIAADPHRSDLIKKAIGDYVERAVAKFDNKEVFIIDQTPSFSTTARGEDRPTKRLKTVPIRRLDAGGPKPPRISNLAPMPSATVSMAGSVLLERRDQAPADQANCTEPNPQPKNLSPNPYLGPNIDCFEGEWCIKDGNSLPDWFSRGLALDIPMPEIDNVSQQPLNVVPSISETWWLGRGICLEAESLFGEGMLDSREQPPSLFD